MNQLNFQCVADKPDIATKLRQILAERQIQQGDLASAVGLSKSQFSQMMSGGIRWRLEHIRAIAKHLNIPVNELLGVEESPMAGLLVPLSKGELRDLTQAAKEELRSPENLAHFAIVKYLADRKRNGQ